MKHKETRASPLTSEGARMERKAVRSYLRRRLQKSTLLAMPVYEQMLQWMLNRQTRYDSRPGGLGK